MRFVVPVLLFAFAVVASDATGGELEELFDPANPRFRLRPLETEEFRTLSAADRLRARGHDARLWRDPPLETDTIAQAHNIRDQLFWGFAFEKRLDAPRKAFEALARLLRSRPLLAPLFLHELAPDAFSRTYRKLTDGIPRPYKRHPPLMALRHSERQFRDWYIEEMGRHIRDAGSHQKSLAIRRLRSGLRDREPEFRLRCARGLGGTGALAAAQALELAVPRERDPEVIGALVAARGRIGGERLRDLLVLWAAHPREALRRAVVRQCGAQGERWATDLLRSRLAEERGRLRDDIAEALGAAVSGPVDFYGITTSSREILFCIDVSGSMAHPMDGFGGKRERRDLRTKRELRRTLESLETGTRFNVVLFAGELQLFRRGLVDATPESVGGALDFVDAFKPVGATNVYGVLDYALRSGADTVYLLTDGEPSAGQVLDPDHIIEEVAARNAHGRVVIHAVGLSRDQNAELLVNLAHRTGGRYVSDR